jgi:probable HAF family extracellular repeat protein
MRSITVFAFGFFILTTLSSAQQFQYFQYPGVSSTSVSGVNNNGVIVGYYLDAQSNAHGFSLSNGKYTGINDPEGSNTIPSGINSSGTIVGSYYSSSSNAYHAFSYSNGAYTDIEVGAECLNTYAYGIDDAGDMAGECQTDSLMEGWIYQDGSFQLVAVPGAEWSYATDINIHGLTTMIWSTDSATGRIQSSVYNGKTFRNIDEPNKKDTYAWAINAAGNVAISWLSGDSSYGALLMGNTYHNIQPTQCKNGTNLTGINDHNLAVGGCFINGHTQVGMIVTF